jgi:hypothetical protein
LNDKSEKWSVLGNENEYISSKKKFVGVQPFIAAKKLNKTEN